MGTTLFYWFCFWPNLSICRGYSWLCAQIYLVGLGAQETILEGLRWNPTGLHARQCSAPPAVPRDLSTQPLGQYLIQYETSASMLCFGGKGPQTPGSTQGLLLALHFCIQVHFCAQEPYGMLGAEGADLIGLLYGQYLSTILPAPMSYLYGKQIC